MKIISKHKDYYDPMVVVYGRDEKIIYDRRASGEIGILKKPKLSSSLENRWSFRLFSICDEYFPLVVKNNGEEYRWQPEQFPKRITLKRENRWSHEFYCLSKLNKYYGKKSTLNSETGQPVLIQSFGQSNIPILAEWNFPKMISADDMYHKIYTWLCWIIDNPPIPNNQSDKEKIISHGYDPKTSFRPKMKD
jgi:hypothetical protein